MEWKLLSDSRVGGLFLLLLLIFPIDTAKGLSIVLFHIIDFPGLAYGWLWLLGAFAFAFAVSNLVFYLYDKKKGLKYQDAHVEWDKQRKKDEEARKKAKLKESSKK
ncbi:MAG: hypothetical protein HY831_04005 [Candidatus Aenigmarchaeota archaeon]|nr:hypothetical protein [Candidatus Aenigmarchaeota archaeon]